MMNYFDYIVGFVAWELVAVEPWLVAAGAYIICGPWEKIENAGIWVINKGTIIGRQKMINWRRVSTRCFRQFSTESEDVYTLDPISDFAFGLISSNLGFYRKNSFKIWYSRVKAREHKSFSSFLYTYGQKTMSIRLNPPKYVSARLLIPIQYPTNLAFSSALMSIELCD